MDRGMRSIVRYKKVTDVHKDGVVGVYIDLSVWFRQGKRMDAWMDGVHVRLLDF